jgi:ABC-type transport system involved in multi-copper enzyme maturation permease subunit
MTNTLRSLDQVAYAVWKSLHWRERAALLVAIVALALEIRRARAGSPITDSLLVITFISAVLICTRRAWIGLFGPVFVQDAVYSARRANLAILRAGYGALLIGVLFVFYAGALQGQTLDLWTLMWQPNRVSRNQMARMGAVFFMLFSFAQLGTVLLITPVCAAGAISEEKERRSLEFLLVTDLRNHEIALGKVAARISFLALLVLTGLPVAVSLQFLGGIDPNQVLAVFAMTASTLFSVAALSLACSVAVRSTRLAIFLSYMWIAVFVGFSMSWLAIPPFGVHNGGNPFVAAFVIFSDDMPATIGPWDTLAVTVVEYVAVHGMLTIACCAWAVIHLRSSAALEAGGETALPVQVGRAAASKNWEGPKAIDAMVIAQSNVLPPAFETEPRQLPRVGDHPMIWKELYAEPLLGLGPTGRGVVVAFLALFLILGGWALFVGFTLSSANGHLAEFSNNLARFGASTLVCLFLLAVGQRAAGSLTTERYRRTLDGLLVSNLGNREILFAKWLASIHCARKGWIAVAFLCLLLVLTGGLHPLAYVALLLAWLCYAAFAAMLGLWFSLRCQTNFRANVLTAATLLVAGAGNLGAWMVLLRFFISPGSAASWTRLSDFVRWGLGPPVTLNVLAFRGSDMNSGAATPVMIGYGIMGVATYGLAALALWWLLLKQFDRLAGRAGALPRQMPPVLDLAQKARSPQYATTAVAE